MSSSTLVTKDLEKREQFGRTQQREPCEDGGRGGSDWSLAEECLGPLEAGRAKEGATLWREHGPDTFDFGIWPQAHQPWDRVPGPDVSGSLSPPPSKLTRALR